MDSLLWKKKNFKRDMLRGIWLANFNEKFSDSKERDRYAYLTKALRAKERGAEPVFYRKDNAFLLIILQKQNPIIILKREWGIIEKSRQSAIEKFKDMFEARERRDLIVKHKLRQGYKPIF